jgi:uncharacterized membrane protein YphA (DoxX/SURF4 family)
MRSVIASAPDCAKADLAIRPGATVAAAPQASLLNHSRRVLCIAEFETPQAYQHDVVMNIALWVLKVLLAVVFVAHGWLFLSPPAEIVTQMNESLPRWFQVFLGTAEILAAVGLILPGLTRILPWLVVWAAGGIMFVLASATVWHVARNEMSSAATTLGLLVMATVVAYMRRRVAPIPSRRPVYRESASSTF